MMKDNAFQLDRVTLVNPSTGQHTHVWYEVVTPERAAELLANLHGNQRPVEKRQVEAYADMMRRGKWYAEVDPVQMTDYKAGATLINGQHRMSAVVKYGKPVTMMMMAGAPDESIHAFDDGHKRSLVDLLHMNDHVAKGVANRLASSAMNNLIVSYMSWSQRCSMENLRRVIRLTASEQFNLSKHFPEFRERLLVFDDMVKASDKSDRVMAYGPCFAGFYLHSLVDYDAAFGVAQTMHNTGGMPFDNRGNKSAAFHVYHYLRRFKEENKSKGVRQGHAMCLFNWAFNQVRLKTDIKKMPELGKDFNWCKKHAGTDKALKLFEKVEAETVQA